MQLKDAIASLQQEHPEDSLLPLFTPWGEKIAAQSDGAEIKVWQEYPRPQLRRDDCHILNGMWNYTILPIKPDPEQDAGACEVCEVIPGRPLAYKKQILVPFSPESLLSRAGSSSRTSISGTNERLLFLLPSLPGKQKRGADAFFILTLWTSRRLFM